MFLLTVGQPSPADDGHAPCAKPAGGGPYSGLPVYEGAGFAGIEFGHSAADVERTLGPAEGGSEHHLRYASSGISFCFCGGQVKDFHFRDGFRGKLYASGLGIGDTIEQVVAAYGDISDRREVDDLCGWKLDRTLLVRRDGPTPDDPAATKLYYYDAGVMFIFDAENRVLELGLFQRTDYLQRLNPPGGGR